MPLFLGFARLPLLQGLAFFAIAVFSLAAAKEGTAASSAEAGSAQQSRAERSHKGRRLQLNRPSASAAGFDAATQASLELEDSTPLLVVAERTARLRGSLADLANVQRLTYTTSAGDQGTIPVAAEWEAIVPVAEGDSELYITALFRDGSSEQIVVRLLLPPNANTGNGQTRGLRPGGTVLIQTAGQGPEEVAYSLLGNLMVVDQCIIIGELGKPGIGANLGAPIDGFAVATGTVATGTVAAGTVTANQASSSGPGNRAAFVVNAAIGPRWTNNTVPYVLDDSLTEAQRNNLRRAMDWWEANTPIRFKLRTTESLFTRATRLTPDEGACFSSIGMPAPGSEGFLRLAESCSQATLIHELGHTIGLLHEQSRADRSRFVRINLANMDSGDRAQSRPQFDRGAGVAAYDPGSVMHYGPFSFARFNDPVMRTIPRGIAMANAEGTATDIFAVRRAAGETAPEITISSNPPGLQVTVDGETITTPRRFSWANGTTHTLAVANEQGTGDLRQRFARWSNEGPAAQTITVNENDRVYTAHHVPLCKLLLGLPAPIQGGTFSVEPYAADDYYPCDSEVTLRATPNEGFQFARWSYLDMGGVNPLTLRVGRAYTNPPVRPIFSNQPLLTVASVPTGRFVTVNGQRWRTPVRVDFPAEGRVTLAAADQTQRRVRFAFRDWSQGGSATQTVTSTGDARTVTANFRTRHEVVTLAQGTAGSTIRLNPASPDGYYDEGSTVTFTALPGTGGTFRAWGGDLSGTQLTTTREIRDQTLAIGNFLGGSAPTVAAQNLRSVAAGASPTALHVTGTFIGDGWTQVRVNGQARSSAQIFNVNNVEVPLTAEDLAQAGSLRIQLANPNIADGPTSVVTLPVVAGTSCNLTLENNSATLPAAGGAVITALRTGNGCGWNPVSSAAWLETLGGPVTGGPGFLNLYAQANSSANARTATVQVGGQQFLVTQEGSACRAQVQSEAALEANQTLFTFGVGVFQAGCAWEPTTDADWFTVAASAKEGTGVVTIQTSANETGAARRGTVRILGQTVAVRQEPSFGIASENGIVNAASLRPGPLSPGGLFVVQGAGFAADPTTASLPAPESLGGVTLTVGETKARILAVSNNRVLAQLPFGTALGETNLTISTAAGATATAKALVAATAPGLWRTEEGRAAMTGEEGNALTNAAPDAVVQFTATGFGVTEPSVPDGDAAPAGAKPVAAVALSIGGQAATLLSAELVAGEVGKLRLTVRVPALEAGEHDVLLTVGEATDAPAKISVQP